MPLTYWFAHNVDDDSNDEKDDDSSLRLLLLVRFSFALIYEKKLYDLWVFFSSLLKSDKKNILIT